MKQYKYRKRLTAVADRCVYILQSIPLCSEKFDLLLFWPRLVHADLAMHATLAALGTLPRSMSCEPLRPVGDTQAVSYGALFQTVQSAAPGLQLATSIYRRATTLRAHV